MLGSVFLTVYVVQYKLIVEVCPYGIWVCCVMGNERKQYGQDKGILYQIS